MSCKPFPDSRVEAHYSNRTTIAGEPGHHGLGKSTGIAAARLQFEEQRLTASDQLQQLAESWNILVRIEKLLPRKARRRGCFDRKPRCAHAAKIMIMEDDRTAVTSHPDIAFDSRARGERGTKSSNAVFGNARTMESAMRKPHGARI